MEGFIDGAPVLAKVTWAAGEVQLWSGKATTYGLLAEVPTSGVPGGITRYFVPWSAVSYLKQDLPVPAAPVQQGVVTQTGQSAPKSGD